LGLVVWDYHVILVLRRPTGDEDSLVYDLDTILDVPCGARHYLEKTFPYYCDTTDLVTEQVLDPVYQSVFRIVPASEFIDNFASDRSHMIASDSSSHLIQDEQVAEEVRYLAPPPSYAPLQGAIARELGVRHNLMTDFVDMEAIGFGRVVSLSEFINWCTAPSQGRV